MSRWDLARARSQQPARKYKPVGPVGEKQDCIAEHMRDRARGRVATSLWIDPQEITACTNCGHHVCSCPPKRVYRGVDLGDSESVSRSIIVETVAGKLEVREVEPYRCAACRAGEPCWFLLFGVRTCSEVTP